VKERLGTADDNNSMLLTLDIKRLVVPLQAWKRILKFLHHSHQGISYICSNQNLLLLARNERRHLTTHTIL